MRCPTGAPGARADFDLAIGEDAGTAQFSPQEARDDVGQSVLVNRSENVLAFLPVPQVPHGGLCAVKRCIEFLKRRDQDLAEIRRRCHQLQIRLVGQRKHLFRGKRRPSGNAHGALGQAQIVGQIGELRVSGSQLAQRRHGGFGA